MNQRWCLIVDEESYHSFNYYLIPVELREDLYSDCGNRDELDEDDKLRDEIMKKWEAYLINPDTLTFENPICE